MTPTTETLKNGEALTILCATAPSEEWGAKIAPLLGHKPENYRAHIEAALAGDCDRLETRFYIGVLDGEIVGNIMTVERRGVGILGHVFTRPEQRRKGVCRAIMAHQMQDFRDRDGHALLLGTGYESAPYWIYYHFGFRDLPGANPGIMHWLRTDDPDFRARFFAPGTAATIAPARWEHWPLVALLAAQPELPRLRSVAFDAVAGPTLLEGPYCAFLHRWKDDARASAAALESTASGAVMAFATRIPDERGPDFLLDVFAHPNVAPNDLCALIESVAARPGPTQCHADPDDPAAAPKISALERCGFTRRDASVYARP